MFRSLTKKEASALPRNNPTIVVPYRDQLEQNRSEQLTAITHYFSTNHPSWPVLVVEQDMDDRKFNRGALLNIGYDLSDTPSLILHDVDLIPKPSIVPFYSAFPTNPIHLGKSIKKYDSPNFLGAVLSVSKPDYELVNGFPNNFWGWGGEDDAFRIRLGKESIKVWQPAVKSGYTELPHVDTRTHPEWKNMRKYEELAKEREGTNKSGLSDLNYDILEKTQLAPSVLKVMVHIKQ
jgi:hypothetical protein